MKPALRAELEEMLAELEAGHYSDFTHSDCHDALVKAGLVAGSLTYRGGRNVPIIYDPEDRTLTFELESSGRRVNTYVAKRTAAALRTILERTR